MRAAEDAILIISWLQISRVALHTCSPLVYLIIWKLLQNKRLRMILEEETQSYRRRYDALYSLDDAVLEAFVSGKGPFGPIGLYGLWFGILVNTTLQDGRLLIRFLNVPCKGS